MVPCLEPVLDEVRVRGKVLVCAPEATVLSPVASSGKTRGRWPFEKGVETGKAQGPPPGETRGPTTQKHTPVGKGPAWIFVHRHEPAGGPVKSNRIKPRGCKSTVQGRAKYTTPSSGQEKRQKSGSRPVAGCRTACARAQKNQRTRQRGGAHPPERHQPPDQDSEHSRRPPRVPHVPYMQRVVVHGGLVGLHTRAQRESPGSPPKTAGFSSPARPASSPARAAWEGAAKLVDFIVPRRRFLSTPCCAKKGNFFDCPTIATLPENCHCN